MIKIFYLNYKCLDILYVFSSYLLMYLKYVKKNLYYNKNYSEADFQKLNSERLCLKAICSYVIIKIISLNLYIKSFYKT